jgi:D-aminoacyl-tRNA deacylase
VKLLLWTEDDPASRGIARALRAAGLFRGAPESSRIAVDPDRGAALGRVDGSLLSADFADRAFGAPAGARFDRALFLSKHSAASGVTALTAHPIGNLGPEAKLGGAPRTLAPADGAALTPLFIALAREARGAGVAAAFEATHHGPRMDLPSLFVEVGSGPADWQNESYCAAVARAVIAGYIEPALDGTAPAALALGGGHYHPRHADRARADGTRFGHFIPAHALADLRDSTLREAAALSRASSFVVDARSERPRLDQAARLLEAAGLARVDLEP